MANDVRTNIGFCRNWLNSYLSMSWWKKILCKVKQYNVDYKELYLRQLVANAVLRNRLYQCKNDNNKLKKQYLDCIRCLIDDPEDELNIRRTSDIFWDLDTVMAKKIANYIRKFQKRTNSIPSSILEDFRITYCDAKGNVLETTDRYDEDAAILYWKYNVLEKIAKAFEMSYKDDEKFGISEKQQQERDEGLQLFVKHFDDLWI